MARILVAAMPFSGHVAPMSGVVAELASRGHDVVVYTGSRYTARFAALGASVIPWNRAPDFDEHNLTATITVIVNSGWRSPEYQDLLLHDAVATYGTEQEAARWVATAETSPHVQGAAVDVGSYDAVDWLAENGARYGLCQIYDNEAWHFELRPEAVDSGCPRKFFDPTYDPRMQ